MPGFFKYLVGDSSSPYSSVNSAKCIYKKLFIFIAFLLTFPGWSDRFEPSARGFGN